MSERDGGIGGGDGDDDVFEVISVDFFFSIILKSDSTLMDLLVEKHY